MCFNDHFAFQVCNLMWSRSTQQLISTHGFTLNEVVVWDLQFNSNDESSIHESNGLPSYQMTPTLHQDFRFPSFNFYSRRIQSNSGATSVRASISKVGDSVVCVIPSLLL